MLHRPSLKHSQDQFETNLFETLIRLVWNTQRPVWNTEKTGLKTNMSENNDKNCLKQACLKHSQDQFETSWFETLIRPVWNKHDTQRPVWKTYKTVTGLKH